MEVINHVFMLWASQIDKYEHRAVLSILAEALTTLVFSLFSLRTNFASVYLPLARKYLGVQILK